MLFPAAKSKGQSTTAFLRVLKYSTGGVLEVIIFFLFFSFLWDMLDFVASVGFSSYPMHKVAGDPSLAAVSCYMFIFSYFLYGLSWSLEDS